MAKIPLPGSERNIPVDAHCVGNANPSEQLEVTVFLRRNGEQELQALVGRLATGDVAAPHLSRAEFAGKYCAAPENIARVAAFARNHSLQVVGSDPACSTVTLSGTVAQCNRAFDVDLQRYTSQQGDYRGRVGALHIPEELLDIVTAVIGLDNRPQARSHFRLHPPFRFAPHSVATSYLPTQLATLYDFPDNQGKGQCIAIIELGGGYKQSDLQTYFTRLGIPVPNVTAVAVNGPGNQPSGDPNGPDGEVVLDIEIAGAIAPEAQIVVYFSTNTDAGFINALNRAVHDSQHQPSIISISWGSAEAGWTQQSMQAFNAALQAAAAMGVTVCVASGDNGSSDGVTDGANHVDFPASSPYALACGGTRLLAGGSIIEREVVWNDGSQGGAGGGGVSAVFTLPLWQQNLTLTSTNGKHVSLAMRGVPDVAGNADPATGYQVHVDGSDAVVGGTSAVAPLWAALFARINAGRGSAVGYVNARLYQQPSAFRDITQGNNGNFAATPGWDACTGLGSPDGKKLAGGI
ncbi:kumamolisin [Collimonas arenae]|uniref:Kumamolisin n=1 Tax=Collimonas arenae TaxID=279058 RepID=A0A127QDE2_9BURK|nr:S53 family peptidase [Collimonas arenae]AMP08060.1 kumamolisin [Collimonas arenae]